MKSAIAATGIPGAPLRVFLLGPFRLEVDGIPARIGGRKGIALLACLVRRGGAVPRESLMALLWPDSAEPQARASLRQTLAALRRDLGGAAAAIRAGTGDAVALDRTVVSADTDALAPLAASASAEVLERAQALVRGAFLEGLGPITPEFDRWADAERAALRSAHETLLLRLCDARAAEGRTDEMIATALRLLTLDPLQEHVHRRVIDGYRRLQRHDAALRQFETLRAILRDELGVDPQPATLDLMRDIRKTRSAPGAAAPLPAPVRPGPAVPSARPSIAVLPFAGLPEGSDAALLGEGIAEEVIVNLSRDRGLLVVARQSSFHPQVLRASPAEIGAQLGVRFLLSGSVRIAGGRIRVMAHLTSCEDAADLWSETYDRVLDDIFALQSEIAAMVMATATGQIADCSPVQAVPVVHGKLDAWRLVLLGLRHLHAHTPESMQAAIDALARAVALAPEDGRALGLLALARIYARWNFEAQADVSDLLPLAERAVALDRRDSRAQCALALACLLRRDHDRAGRHFQAGLAANPNDDLLRIEFGRYLLYVDRPEEGLSSIREAMRLNPRHPDWFWNIQGRCLHLLGRHAEALDAFRRVAAPAYYHLAYMAVCLRALGDTAAAERMRKRLFLARPDFDVARFIAIFPHANPQTAARFAREFAWLQAEGAAPPRQQDG